MSNQQNQPTLRLLFNPDIVSHEFDYDKFGPEAQHFIVPALNAIRVPVHMADTFASHLADLIINKRGIKNNYALDKETILKEILP